MAGSEPPLSRWYLDTERMPCGCWIWMALIFAGLVYFILSQFR